MPPCDFAERLRLALEGAGMSPEELDRRMEHRPGGWPGTEALICGSARQPPDHIASRLAHTLGVSPLWLIAGAMSATAARLVRQIGPLLERAAMTEPQREDVIGILERLP
jgi:hypothetical protein